MIGIIKMQIVPHQPQKQIETNTSTYQIPC
jgi:hypothetical protein